MPRFDCIRIFPCWTLTICFLLGKSPSNRNPMVFSFRKLSLLTMVSSYRLLSVPWNLLKEVSVRTQLGQVHDCWLVISTGTIVKTLLLTVSHASASFQWSARHPLLTASSHATILDPSLPQLAPQSRRSLPVKFRVSKCLAKDRCGL